MPAEAVVTTLRQAWQVLAGLQIPAALMGGLALAHWGRIRSTQDVDLLIALTDHPQKLLSQLSAAGCRSKGDHPLVRVGELVFIQLIYEPPDGLLDVQLDLLLADSPFHRQAIERRIALPASVLGFELDVVSCEDLIILKMLAGRILDRVDAAELLKLNQSSLDWGYLKDWVLRLNLQQSFGQAWALGMPGVGSPV